MSRNWKTVSLVRLTKLLLPSLAVLYIIVCAAVAVSQRSLIYYPRIFRPDEMNRMARSANLERWKNPTGQFIGFKRPSPKQPAEGTILVTHGNSGTAIDCAHYADDIQKIAAFDVFILEYPGYGDRPGSPSQKNLFQAATEGFQLLPTNKPIYLVGESLGSGVASYLAGTFSNKISGVILISPFDQLAGVAQYHYPYLPVRLLLADPFPSADFLRHYHGKIAFTVDGKDAVVPEKFGLRLFSDYNGPKKLWKFPDGGHCQITEPQTNFWKEAVGFWQNHSNG